MSDKNSVEIYPNKISQEQRTPELEEKSDLLLYSDSNNEKKN
jgi:hypothetical protein